MTQRVVADPTLYRISKVLNLSKRNAHRAKDVGKAMREAGLTDPYVRLTEPPIDEARWRLDPKFIQQKSTLLC